MLEDPRKEFDHKLQISLDREEELGQPKGLILLMAVFQENKAKNETSVRLLGTA